MLYLCYMCYIPRESCTCNVCLATLKQFLHFYIIFKNCVWRLSTLNVSSTRFTRYKFLWLAQLTTYVVRTLILSILLPASPPSLKCTSLAVSALGLDNLNGHKNYLLAWRTTRYNSWIKSSTQAIPLPPSWPSMILLSVKAILCLFTLP